MNTDRIRYSRRWTVLFPAVVILIAAVIYLLAGKSAAQEETMTHSHVIYTATDLHYISPSLTDNGEYFMNMIENSDGKVSDCAEGLTDAFLAEVAEDQPEALILSGDLTFNGAEQSHRNLAEKLRALEEAGVPVLVMPGNHDLNNANAAMFSGSGYTRVDSIDADTFEEIYADFGFTEAISRDTASLSYVYALDDDLWVLMLDVNTADSANTVKAETLTWLSEQLQTAETAGVRIITVSHQNLLQHNSLIVSGYQITNSADVLAMYETGPVIVNLTGHLHCQHIAYSGGGLCEIATSSLAVTPNQYGILTIDSHTAEYHTKSVDVSAWAEAQGLTDTKLLNFADYAAALFSDPSYSQGLQAAGDAQNAEELAEFFTRANRAYFAGRMDTIDPDDPLFEQWKEIGGFEGLYIASMTDDNAANFTQVTLQW